ncbi:MAG: antibiotic biosynthesis monooxygenase [Cyanobacteria bacterium CRU_2_1]|nr:antibiotic biosynthesis monooxygenase [Cyanobacteria bacterium CRU_2_1]
MSASLLTIVARIKAKPGMEERMRQDLLGLLAPTRAESSCITFDLLIDTNDPTVLCFMKTGRIKRLWMLTFSNPT